MLERIQRFHVLFQTTQTFQIFCSESRASKQKACVVIAAGSVAVHTAGINA